MNARALEFVIPGDLQSATGGYLYDRTMVAGLRALGWRVEVHTLDASFPAPSPDALAQAARVFAGLPDEACVLVDGLALGAMPQVLESHARRLAVVALIHMPLAFEFGIAAAVAERRRHEEERALELVRHVIVTSRNTERDLAAYGVDRSRLTVVEPGVWKTSLPDGPRVRAADDPIKLLCVATIQAGKGHELLIDALAPLAHLPWHLQCVGSLTRSPAAVQRLVEQVERLGLTDRVMLAGERPHAELRALYLGADLFVLPTLRESYCLAVAESLAHGLPVISSRTGAIPELVGAAAGIAAGMPAGLLIEPGDRAALLAALERTLTDGALRSSMRAAALAARARLRPWPEACERMARVLDRYRMR
jgi:glycosyltransferase involved in cell wall biosynthesis